MIRYLIKVTIWKNFYKRIVFLLLLKTKVHAQTLKNTQIVMKSFI